PLDDQTGISSAGNAVSLMFGRAALFADVPASSKAYSPRRDGITVRATAIAATVRAKTVGPAYPDLNLPGATPFGLSLAAWKGLTTATVTVDATGLIATATGSGQMLRITSLGADLGATDTTLTVTPPPLTAGAPVPGFPAPPFTVRIDGELL